MESRPDSSVPVKRVLDRRTLLGYAAAGVALALAPLSSVHARVHRTRRNGAWHQRSTWGGAPPGRGDVAVVAHDVRVDRKTLVAGIVVLHGARLQLNAERSVTLIARGNIVVKGRLIARPQSATTRHRIRFGGVKESRMKGGGMSVKSTDVGLWVMDRGSLDIDGSAKIPWLLAGQSVPAGATSIELDGSPTGWRVGDEIAIAPTGKPTDNGHDDAFDTAQITSISGQQIQLSRATSHAHPVVDLGSQRRAPEVLNLTRNVIVEGAPGGRTHVFVHSRRPQRIAHAQIRHVGPRNRGKVAGRYGLHFHHCLGGSRKSVVRGVVVRDCGSHAFVPHLSHGIKFLECIAFNAAESAYWWDPGDPSHDILYDRCVAARIRNRAGDANFRLTGFLLAKGDGNSARGCIAAGVGGTSESSGFFWPGARSEGTWGFTDCVAHNNRNNGIFVWLNSSHVHDVERFVGFHNGRAGIHQGAYGNGFRYLDSLLYGNLKCGVELVARSSEKRQMQFIRTRCDQAGLSKHAVIADRHLAGTRSVIFEDATFRNYQHSALGITPERSKEPARIDVVNCSFDGNEIWIYNSANRDTLIRLSQSGQDPLAVRHPDAEGPGLFKSEWNAKVTVIEPF